MVKVVNMQNISSYIPKYLLKSLKNWISKYVRF